jgi:hypothetical protein
MLKFEINRHRSEPAQHNSPIRERLRYSDTSMRFSEFGKALADLNFNHLQPDRENSLLPAFGS